MKKNVIENQLKKKLLITGKQMIIERVLSKCGSIESYRMDLERIAINP